jgi:DNA-binding NarL/FixJ family response regulator
MIRLFIIDDHPVVITGISQAVGNHPDIELAGHAHRSVEALAWLAANRADVILLDVNLPGMDGIELCKAVKKHYPEVKIIGLTTFSEASFITGMLNNGASGYLFKNTSEKELTDAILAVHAGKRYLSEEVNEKLISKATKQASAKKGFVPKLTRREKEVLDLIMEECTTQEIAERLFLSVSTVETHRLKLFTKLDAKNVVGLVKNAMKFGLV